MKFLAETTIRQKFLGSALKTWRENKKLTQGDVASALGYTTAQFVSNWERGQASPPLDSFAKLARLFGISHEEIVDVVQRYHEALVTHKTNLVRNALKRPKKK